MVNNYVLSTWQINTALHHLKVINVGFGAWTPYWRGVSHHRRTSVLYAISLMAGSRYLIFLLGSPDRLAYVIMFCICLLKDRLLLISTPKYLKLATDSRIWLCCGFWFGTGVPDLFICDSTFVGVELIYHWSSHWGGDQSPAAKVVHLSSWKLPGRWPCRQRRFIWHFRTISELPVNEVETGKGMLREETWHRFCYRRPFV